MNNFEGGLEFHNEVREPWEYEEHASRVVVVLDNLHGGIITEQVLALKQVRGSGTLQVPLWRGGSVYRYTIR